LVGIPIIFGIIFYFAVRLTHHFSGPIYRIEKCLDEMNKSGNFSKGISIRKKDDLQPLVQKFNRSLREASKNKSG